MPQELKSIVEMKIYINELEKKITDNIDDLRTSTKTCTGCNDYHKGTSYGKWCHCSRNPSSDKYDNKPHER